MNFRKQTLVFDDNLKTCVQFFRQETKATLRTGRRDGPSEPRDFPGRVVFRVGWVRLPADFVFEILPSFAATSD